MNNNPSLIEKTKQRLKKEIEKIIEKNKEQLEEEYDIDTESIDVDVLVNHLISSGQILDEKEKFKVKIELKKINYIDEEEGNEVSRDRPVIKVIFPLDENMYLESTVSPEDLEESDADKNYLVFKRNGNKVPLVFKRNGNKVPIEVSSIFPIYQLYKFEGDLDKLEEFINNSPEGDIYLNHFRPVQKRNPADISLRGHGLEEFYKFLAVIIKNKNEGKTVQEGIKKDLYRNVQVQNRDYKDYSNIIVILTNKEIHIAGINKNGMSSVIFKFPLKKDFKERIRFSKSFVDAIDIILNYADLNQINKRLGNDFLVFKFLNCK